jgi:hypothetical protein
MHVEPLDATFGAIVTEIDLNALDAVTWEGTARLVVGARPADLSRPVRRS